MALGERFTRSAVACEFSFLPVSRRLAASLLRPAAGFSDRDRKPRALARCTLPSRQRHHPALAVSAIVAAAKALQA